MIDPLNLKASARRASALLKALGNERRLVILCYLAKGEHSVSVLERLVGLSQSALSQHLARLRREQLVKTRRSAQTIYYSLASHEIRAVIETLYRLYCVDGHGRQAETAAVPEAPAQGTTATAAIRSHSPAA